MTGFAYDRARVLRWGWVAVGIAAMLWYARTYRPAVAGLAGREQAVAVREARVREARTAAVALGTSGLDSLLARFRADSLLLATRVPRAEAGAALDAELKDALGALERRTGVRIAGTEPLPPGTEGPFRSGGYAVRVVGRYEEVGALLAEMSALPRLVRIRGLRIRTFPDSLVRSAQAEGGAAEAQWASADSISRAAASPDASDPPFRASASFDLLWYTLPPAGGTPADSLSSPSTFAPRALP